MLIVERLLTSFIAYMKDCLYLCKQNYNDMDKELLKKIKKVCTHKTVQKDFVFPEEGWFVGATNSNFGGDEYRASYLYEPHWTTHRENSWGGYTNYEESTEECSGWWTFNAVSSSINTDYLYLCSDGETATELAQFLNSLPSKNMTLIDLDIDKINQEICMLEQKKQMLEDSKYIASFMLNDKTMKEIELVSDSQNKNNDEVIIESKIIQIVKEVSERLEKMFPGQWYIGGSYGLKLLGYDLGRECKDIDFVICSDSTELLSCISSGTNLHKLLYGDDWEWNKSHSHMIDNRVRCVCTVKDGIKLDLFIKVQKFPDDILSDIIRFKKMIAYSDYHKDKRKHIDDLVKLGFYDKD